MGVAVVGDLPSPACKHNTEKVPTRIYRIGSIAKGDTVENPAGLPRITGRFLKFQTRAKFICKKAGVPPLGLLTVAAMLPSEWEK
jgi:hypothetical protein